MLQWMKMDSSELKWVNKLVWRACSTCNGKRQEKTYYEISYKPGKQQRMEDLKVSTWSRNSY